MSGFFGGGGGGNVTTTPVDLVFIAAALGLGEVGYSQYAPVVGGTLIYESITVSVPMPQLKMFTNGAASEFEFRLNGVFTQAQFGTLVVEEWGSEGTFAAADALFAVIAGESRWFWTSAPTFMVVTGQYSVRFTDIVP